MPLPPALVFPVADTDATVQVFVGACVLRGWAVWNEGPSSEAICSINDTAGADIVPVAWVSLLGFESTREWFTGNGILLRTGLQLEIDAGSIAASFYLTPITNADDMSFAFGESGPYFVHGGV